MTTQGSGSHLALNSVLLKSGIKLTDVEIISAGTSAMPQALEQGSIDAAMHYDPFTMRALMEGKAFTLLDLSTARDTQWLFGGDYPYTGLVTRRDVIEKKPQLTQKMVTGLVESLRLIRVGDLEAITRSLPPDFRATDAVYRKSLEHMAGAFSRDGLVTEQQVQTVLRSLIESEAIPAGTKAELKDVTDLSFLRRALGQ